METVFLQTVSTSVFSDPPIDISKFLIHQEFRYDSILLRDADGHEQYLLSVVDRPFDESTNIKVPACVWLDPPPPSEPHPLKMEDLQAAAERMGCIRMISVDRRPPGVSDDVVERELYHVVRVLAQSGYFLGHRRYWSMTFDAVHFFSDSNQKVMS